MDISDAMYTYTFGFLKSPPPVGEDRWEVVPPYDWEAREIPEVARRIAEYVGAEYQPVIARLPRLGWCVITRGFLDLPLEYQPERAPALTWSEHPVT
jgi:hypothetical protein